MKIRRFLLHFLNRHAVARILVYGKLMRIDKPIGTLLLLWPTYWALWVASEGIPEADIFWAFTAGTFFMRSAGCVINDFADRDFDGSVERTKNRPFARGLVSKTEAILLTVILCLLDAAEPVDLGDERSRAVFGDDLPLYQTVFPAAAVLFGAGVFFRDSDGVCRCPQQRAFYGVADVHRQCFVDACLRHDLCDVGQGRRFENRD